MFEKSCWAAERFPDCRSLPSWLKAWAAEPLPAAAVELADGEFCCKVAKSAWAADRLPDCRAWPSCWNSCRNCCCELLMAWLLELNRVLLRMPAMDMVYFIPSYRLPVSAAWKLI